MVGESVENNKWTLQLEIDGNILKKLDEMNKRLDKLEKDNEIDLETIKLGGTVDKRLVSKVLKGV